MKNFFAKILSITFFLFSQTLIAHNNTNNVLACYIDKTCLVTNEPQNNNPDTLKILCIGNSYTSDEMSYLPYVLLQLCPEMNVKIGHLMSGSASVSEWWVQRNSATIIGTPVYSTGPRHRYNPDGGFLWTDTRYVEWNSGTGVWSDVVSSAVSLIDALTSDTWDIVTFQQVSELARDYTSISSSLVNLVSLVREKLPKAKVGWLFTHVWNDRYANENNVANSDSCWIAAKDVVKQIENHDLVDFIIPNSTAIQNLRHTKANALGWYYNSEFPNPGLSADGSHLHEGLGCLCASMCAAATLTNLTPNVFLEYSTNWNVYGTNFYDIDNPTPIGMTADFQKTACECAMAALRSPYEITENTGENVLGDIDGNLIIDIDDVNIVINIILKKSMPDNYSENADVTNDGIIDIDDVNAIINIILQL